MSNDEEYIKALLTLNKALLNAVEIERKINSSLKNQAASLKTHLISETKTEVENDG